MSARLLVDDAAVAAVSVDPQRRRLGLAIWALLFFNGMAFTTMPLLVPIPNAAGKLATQAALATATFLVLILNRDRLIRPNLFLSLYSLLALFALMASLRMNAGAGSLLRAGRFVVFIAVLWLLTALWGRRDRVLLQWHIICLTAIVAMVAVGGILAPGKARAIDGRLASAIWPIPPPQVGHYAAVLTGLVVVLLLAREAHARVALPVAGVAVVVLLLTHTRTALIALIAGVFAATLVLVPVRRRARHAALVVIITLLLLGTVFTPVVSHWFARGQSSEQVGSFNGRQKVWDALVQTPRSDFEKIFGHGLTNKSFNGLAIDNSWYATYLDEGLLGDALCAAILIALVMLATTRPRDSSLALAIFIIAYCAMASWTETGLGDVSPYVLDLTVAASLLAPASAMSFTKVSFTNRAR
jgi:O-antigen ligase